MAIIDDFISLEEKYNFFDYKINNLEIWKFIRFSVLDLIINEKEGLTTNYISIEKSNLREKAKILFNLIKNTIILNPFLCSREVDLIVINHPRRKKVNNNYDCIYTDEFLSNLKCDYCVLENHYFGIHEKEVRTKNLKYMDNTAIIKKVREIVFRKIDLFNRFQTDIEYFKEKIDIHFSIELDTKMLARLIGQVMVNYKYLYNYYKKLLLHLNPKMIIEVVYYNLDNMIINIISKELHIQTFELQHGVMGRYHVAYNFHGHFNLDTFPDNVIVYGEYWKNTTRFPILSEKIFVSGSIYLENMAKQYSNAKVRRKKEVLFLSQGDVGEYLYMLALDLVAQLDTNIFHITFKLHPGEYLHWKDNYPKLNNCKFIDVIDNNEKDLHYYLSRTDIQVGVSSTTLFEGLYYNNLTFILKVFGWEYMNDFIQNGYMILIEDVNDIIKNLDKKIEFREIEKIWESDALNKMTQLINNVVNKNL